MPRTKSASKVRGWVVTVNNITDAEYELLKVKIPSKENVRYFCGQLEVGESGTRHLQAMCEFKGPVGLSTLRNLFPRCHAEVRRGTPQQAQVYCTKSKTAVADTRFEWGEIPANREQGQRQGARTDLDEVREAIRGGAEVREILELYPVVYARYPRYVDKCLMVYSAHRNWKTRVRVYVGPTGCGKTSLAYEEYPDIWAKPDGSWFDGYIGQPHVLIDDFHGGRDCGVSFSAFLRLLDRYGMDVAVKGAFARWVPRVIIITSNYEPDQWFPWEDVSPLMRRINCYIKWSRDQ